MVQKHRAFAPKVQLLLQRQTIHDFFFFFSINFFGAATYTPQENIGIKMYQILQKENVKKTHGVQDCCPHQQTISPPSYLSAFFTALANSLEVDAAFTSLLRLSSEESHVVL